MDTQVFGYFGNPQDAWFVHLLLTLATTEDDGSMKLTVRVKTKKIEALLKCETVLTAQVFLCILSSLSKYLQTRGTDILPAQRLVEGAENSLRKCVRDFNFSTLKFVKKNELRSTLTQEQLGAFMLISTEKETYNSIT